MCAQLCDIIDPYGGDETPGLSLHYQPIVNLTHGAIRGHEALPRYTPPGGDPIPAADLIDAAEHTGRHCCVG